MVQLLILASLGVLVLAPLLLISAVLERRGDPATRRRLLPLLGFHAGALLIGWVTWRTLKPADWALSFWATVRAGVDSETYGHLVEHQAEVMAANVVVLAAAAGLLLGGLVWVFWRAPGISRGTAR